MGWSVEFKSDLFLIKFACKMHNIMWVISISAHRTTDRVRMVRTVTTVALPDKILSLQLTLDGHVRGLDKDVANRRSSCLLRAAW